MRRDVVTIGPDESVEAAVSLAQRNKVGSTVVVEDGKVVGIVTSNDLIRKILNPLLGLAETGEPVKGQRIIVYQAGSAEHIEKVMECISELGLKATSFCNVGPSEGKENDLIIHLDTADVSQLIVELKKLGYSVLKRQR